MYLTSISTQYSVYGGSMILINNKLLFYGGCCNGIASS